MGFDKPVRMCGLRHVYYLAGTNVHGAKALAVHGVQVFYAGACASHWHFTFSAELFECWGCDPGLPVLLAQYMALAYCCLQQGQ
jgi:hypothetical protein